MQPVLTYFIYNFFLSFFFAKIISQQGSDKIYINRQFTPHHCSKGFSILFYFIFLFLLFHSFFKKRESLKVSNNLDK